MTRLFHVKHISTKKVHLIWNSFFFFSEKQNDAWRNYYNIGLHVHHHDVKTTSCYGEGDDIH